jgi:cobalt/nickel transport system permease protein
LTGAVLIILRVGVSVSLAVLLTITSKWGELLKALRVFFVPKIFIMVLEMTYRYIFLLLTVITDMFIARKSRTIGANSLRENRRFVSVGIGNVFGKAYFLSEEIHDAMISRGYTGEAKVVNNFKITPQDIVWIFLVLAVGIFFWGGDLILGR